MGTSLARGRRGGIEERACAAKLEGEEKRGWGSRGREASPGVAEEGAERGLRRGGGK